MDEYQETRCFDLNWKKQHGITRDDHINGKYER